MRHNSPNPALTKYVEDTMDQKKASRFEQLGKELIDTMNGSGLICVHEAPELLCMLIATFLRDHPDKNTIVRDFLTKMGVLQLGH